MEPTNQQPDSPDDWADVEWVDAVSDGSGPAPWHVRDQQARIRELPPCEVAPAVRDALTPVRLETYPATIWLPAEARAQADDARDQPPAADAPVAGSHVEVDAWEWPNGDTLECMISTSPGLPGLHALTGYTAADRHAVVGGRPLRVRRHAYTFGEGATVYFAVVDGHLDDLHEVYGNVHATTPEARDALLAVLLTLTPDAPPAGAVGAGG